MSDDERIEKLAHDVLPGLKVDAAVLTASAWPTTPGSLPTCGSYQADETNDSLFPSSGPFGPFIWKAGHGVRFDLETVGTKVEFHPSGGPPASFVTDFSGLVEHVLEKYVLLEPNWYLAWYSVVDLP